MKALSKKSQIVCITLGVVLFFTALITVLVISGKIDVTSMPVIRNVLNYVSTFENTVEVTPSNQYTSVTDIDKLGDYIYAADKTGKKVYKLDDSGNTVAVFSGDSQINAVTVSENYVYVLSGSADGKVIVLNHDLDTVKTVNVGHTPSALAIKGTKAYIANRYDNTVSVMNTETNEIVSEIALNGREVIDLAIAGDKLYAAFHLPDEASTDTTVSADVAVIDTATDTVIKNIGLINGAGGVKGIAAAADGSKVYVTHVIARYAYPTTQLDRGWINTNGFSVIDTADDTSVALLLDEVELGAANPWGVDVSDDGKTLIFTISGTDEAMIVDVDAMNAKINAVKSGSGLVSTTEKIADYLPFLDGCRTRISLSGKGARTVKIHGTTAYIGQYFSGNIEKIDLNTHATSSINFITQPENDAVRTGEILFSDATLCYQQWESCLSCHPDAAADGFNWDNLNDGLGNPKSAKSMLYSHRTPPVMATGIRDSAEVAVRAGMKFIQFNVIEEEKLACIDEYLKSLTPVQSPYLNSDGTLTESAQRGKTLFEQSGCSDCHPAPFYTDMKTHDVGTTEDTDNWENRALDTPSLVEVWKTGAWLHDGRYNRMQDAVKHFAPNLSDDEIYDLSSFVLSIGDEGEGYGVEQIIVEKDDETAVNKLISGGKITALSVRNQSENATDAVIKITLKSGDGKEIISTEKNISDMADNTAQKISLYGFDIPQDDSGATLTVTFTDASGNLIATPFVLKY